MISLEGRQSRFQAPGTSFSFEFGIKRYDVIEADLISKLSGPLLEDAF